MMAVVEMEREIFIDIDRVVADDGDDQVGREEVPRLEGKGRRERFVGVFKDGEMEDVLECVELMVDRDAVVEDGEPMHARRLIRRKRRRHRRRDHDKRQKKIPEQDAGDSDGGRDDAERPVPVRLLLLESVLSPFPRK